MSKSLTIHSGRGYGGGGSPDEVQRTLSFDEFVDAAAALRGRPVKVFVGPRDTGAVPIVVLVGAAGVTPEELMDAYAQGGPVERVVFARASDAQFDFIELPRAMFDGSPLVRREMFDRAEITYRGDIAVDLTTGVRVSFEPGD